MDDQASERHPDGFVNRERELAELRAGLQDACAGRGRFFLLAGDPGIGKTRLADEFCKDATRHGAHVLWGRCWEAGGAPAFWPWTQIIRTYAQQCAPEALARHLGREAADIAQLVPELKAISPPEPSTDAEGARFRLFDATSIFLRAAAQAQPLLLVLDDLHAADQPTLRLLQFVTRDLRATRLLVLGIYRDTPVRQNPALQEVFGELGRECCSITLHGLGEADVARLVRTLLGGPPDPALVESLHRITGGNPFFVDAVVRVLIGERRLALEPQQALVNLRIPAHLREALRQHFRPLPASVLTLLSVAAVIGQEFALGVLERVVNTLPTVGAASPELLLDALGVASRARLVTETAPSIGGYRFTHALIRETLYGDLAPMQRLQVHRAVAEALEHIYGAQEACLTELAHHSFQALPYGDIDTALTYQVHAGELAMRHLAHELAAEHFERALQACAMQEPPQRERECEILLALGAAQARGTGTAAARQTFLRAAALAQQLRAGDLQARAALGVADVGMGLPGAAYDRTKVDLFENSLAALDNTDSALRVRLLSRLAVELYYHAPAARRAALTGTALEMARHLGDPEVVGHALSDRHAAMWTPDNADERLALAMEASGLAEQADDDELRLRASMWMTLNLFERGDGEALDQQIDECARRAAALRQPRHLWLATHFRAVRAQSRGDFADAERLAQEALEFGQRAEDAAAPDLFTTLLYAVRAAQGRLDEFEPVMRAYWQRFPERVAVRCGLAYLCAELGRVEDARSEFEALARDGFALLPWDHCWVSAIAYLAHVCAFLGDVPRADMLYDMLYPYRQRIVTLGHPNTFVDLPVAHYLGVLAATLSRHDAARQHFEASIQLATCLGSRPAIARTQYEHARLVLGQLGRAPAVTPLHQTRAAQLLAAALRTADELGMARLAAQARTLLATVGCQESDADRHRHARGGAGPVCDIDRQPTAVVANPAPDTRQPSSELTFCREGDVWALAYEGHTCRLKNLRGLGYIATLVSRPGEEVHAIELVHADGGTDGRAHGSAAGAADGLEIRCDGDAGELLDAQAKAAYARRLEDLREELEEARGFNDMGRAERAREEMEFLTCELSRAIGLRGRHRRAGSRAERARVNVTRAISLALHKIAEWHPRLHSYLEEAVKTGTFCVYAPPSMVPPTRPLTLLAPARESSASTRPSAV